MSFLLFGMPLRPLGDLKMVGFEIHQEAIGDLVGAPRKDAEIVKICEDEPGTNGRFTSQHGGLCNMFSLEV